MLILTSCIDSEEQQISGSTIEPSTSTVSSILDPTDPKRIISPSPNKEVTEPATKQALPTKTPTNPPTETVIPSPEFPIVIVNVAAAHCRYGPSKAYLHAADLYEGDTGFVDGRFLFSDWLYVKWDKLAYHCWVSPYVVNVSGDISSIGYVDVQLWRIPSTLYQAPANVRAFRQGNLVTITWDQVWMTEDDDRGYLIEAWVCQDGAYLWWTVSFDDQYTTSYSVIDDDSCTQSSSGKLYTVEKHGYTEPIIIPWPAP